MTNDTTPAPIGADAALAQLRHLYRNLIEGGVRDTAQAKRIAEGLLAPAIAALERAALASAARRWPPVSGVGRDAGHSRAVVVYLAAEPTDDEMCALHDAVRGEAAAAPKAAPGEPVYREKWDAELGRTAMRFVDRAGDVHPGIDERAHGIGTEKGGSHG